jgi:hypothetical protein
VWLTGIRLSPSRPPQAHHTSRQQRCGGGSRVWVAEPVLKPCNHGVLDSQAPGRHRRRDRQVLRPGHADGAVGAPPQETLCCPCRRVRDGGGGGPLRGQGLGADPGRRGPGVAVGRRGGRASSSTCSPPRFDIVARCHVRRRCFGPNPCSASCFVPLLRDSRNPELMHAWVLLGNCCYSSSTELRLHSIRIVEMLYKASCTCGHIIYKYFRNFG